MWRILITLALTTGLRRGELLGLEHINLDACTMDVQQTLSFTKKNGLRYVNFHALLHTSATLLLNQGLHAKIIQSRLGHANITTTLNIYTHALKEADQAAAGIFDNMLKANKQNRA